MRLYLHTRLHEAFIAWHASNDSRNNIQEEVKVLLDGMDIYICEKLVLVVRLTTIIPASSVIANLCVCAHKTLKNYQNLFL